MKKYMTAIVMALFVLSACSKKESPAEQREKAEATITNTVNTGEKIQNSSAVQAIQSMPEGAPIEANFPGGISSKSILSNVLEGHVPFFKKSETKSPIDSIEGTWEYDVSAGWQHKSNNPADEVVLIWHFVSDDGASHEAELEFKNFGWYNDTLLTKFDVDEYVDSAKVANYSYQLTIQDNVSKALHLSGTLVGIVNFSFDVQAADGHSLDESDFYGTIHISGTNLQDGTSYTIDLVYNDDGSWSFDLVTNDNGGDWHAHLAVSAPDATGAQHVSGYLKNGDTEVATVDGTISEDGDFSGVYIVYSDGTRVPFSTYLQGWHTGN